jgi:hypothetical protein
LAAGDSVPALELLALDGGMRTLPYTSSKATVIYVFAPTCRFCGQNFRNIQRLVPGEERRL